MSMAEPREDYRIVNDPDLVEQDHWDFRDFTELRGESVRAERSKEVIEGIVREGEVLLIGSSSKHGKSWMVGNLIWATVAGKTWLGKEVRRGKVLLIDNELKQQELDWRHSMISREMHHEPKPGELTTVLRRGDTCDIQAIDYQVREAGLNWSQYSLIVIDALYKCIPDGRSENDNEAMAKLMNILQGLADYTNAAVVGIHHSSKGSQSEKTPLDVFAGAGAFGRSLDSAVVFRNHEDPELAVIDFISRTNPPQPQVSAKFEWPIWAVTTDTPELKKAGAFGGQANKDTETLESLTRALSDGRYQSVYELRSTTGYGDSRILRGLNTLLSGKVDTKKFRSKRNGKRVQKYRLSPELSPEKNSG